MCYSRISQAFLVSGLVLLINTGFWGQNFTFGQPLTPKAEQEQENKVRTCQRWLEQTHRSYEESGRPEDLGELGALYAGMHCPYVEPCCKLIDVVDAKKAEYWFTKAVEQGEKDDAIEFLIAIYTGETELKDYVKGYAWMTIYALEEDDLANKQRELKRLEEKMTPEQVEQAKLLAKELQAKMAGMQ